MSAKSWFPSKPTDLRPGQTAQSFWPSVFMLNVSTACLYHTLGGDAKKGRPPSQQAATVSAVVKVLYIEDNDDDVYMLKMRLELLGNFEVLTAEDGEKGSKVAVAEQPDVILMDLEMPVVDGWEAARRLKSNRQIQDIPIIALSAHALAGE